MSLSKKAIQAALVKIREQAEAHGETAKHARYQSDEASAHYYEGARVGRLQAAIELDQAPGLCPR